MNWGYFVLHLLIASAVCLVAITWSICLWFMICRSADWRTFVERERVLLVGLGLPRSLGRVMYRLQTGWTTKLIILLTILCSICVLHLL